MYTIELGKHFNSTSSLEIEGLPPLQLNIHRNGYFDGWITYAEDRDHIWLSPHFESIEQISRRISKQTAKPALQNAQRGDLAILKMMNSWERVLVLERTDTNRAKVYLIDNGANKSVDINHLHPMAEEFRNEPPLVFPVSINPSEPSYGEIPKQDWLALQGVRVAVKIGKLSDSTITCSKFTVFDAESGANLPFLSAAASRKKRFQRAIDDAATTVFVPPQAPPTYTPTPPLKITTTYESTTVVPENSNKLIGLIAISSSAVIIIGLILCLLFFYFKKRRDKRRNPEEDNGDSSLENPSPVEIASQRVQRVRKVETPSKPEYREDDPLELDATTVASIIATIGHGKYEAERRSQRNKELEKEPTDRKEESREGGTTTPERQAGGRSASVFSEDRSNSSSGVYTKSYRAEMDSQLTHTVPRTFQNHQEQSAMSYWDLTQRGNTSATRYAIQHPDLSSIYSEQESESTNHNASTQRTANSYDASSDRDTTAYMEEDVEPSSEISEISEVREILRSFDAQKRAVYTTDDVCSSIDSRDKQIQRKKRKQKVQPMPTLDETLDSYYSANSEPYSEDY